MTEPSPSCYRSTGLNFGSFGARLIAGCAERFIADRSLDLWLDLPVWPRIFAAQSPSFAGFGVI